MLATNREAACVYCNTVKSQYQYDTTDIFGDVYHINKCDNCKAFFLAPQPSAAQLARAYDDSYYGEKENKFSPLIEKILDYFRSKRANIITKHKLPPAKVLDIGCGNGRFLQYVLDKGNFDVYGIELPGKAADRAASIAGITLKRGMLAPNDFAPESLDVVTLFHVFEHLTAPAETLKIISQILKKDGILVISFPNINSLQSKWFKGDWLHLDPPRHLFFFEPTDFKLLITDFGFEVLEENYFSTEYNPFGMQQSILNRLLEKREVLYEHLKGNTNYTKSYSAWHLAAQNMAFKLSYPLFVLSDVFESVVCKRGATVEFVLRKK